MKKLFLLLITLNLGSALFSQSPNHPSRAFLGVNSNHIDQAKAEALGFDTPYGAYITQVYENTTAEKAGIQPFDYLTGINNKAFTASRRFQHVMSEYNAGEQATIQMIRGNQAMSIPVTFGKQSDAIYRKIPKEEEPFLGVKQDHYNWKENIPGVKVQIVEKSAAEQMDLQDNDIITAINGQQIIDWHDLGNMIDNMKPGDPISIDFLRDGKTMSAQTNIKSYGETYMVHDKQETKVMEEEEAKPAEEIEQAFSVNMEEALEMENISQQEADDMKKKVGVDMPIINNLEIEKLNIFPNPNDGLFNLMFELPNRGQTSIRIFNSVGKLVYQNDLQQFSGVFKDRIDISGRAKGFYFLAINQDGKSITKKVALQ